MHLLNPNIPRMQLFNSGTEMDKEDFHRMLTSYFDNEEKPLWDDEALLLHPDQARLGCNTALEALPFDDAVPRANPFGDFICSKNDEFAAHPASAGSTTCHRDFFLASSEESVQLPGAQIASMAAAAAASAAGFVRSFDESNCRWSMGYRGLGNPQQDIGDGGHRAAYPGSSEDTLLKIDCSALQTAGALRAMHITSAPVLKSENAVSLQARVGSVAAIGVSDMKNYPGAASKRTRTSSNLGLSNKAGEDCVLEVAVAAGSAGVSSPGSSGGCLGGKKQRQEDQDITAAAAAGPSSAALSSPIGRAGLDLTRHDHPSEDASDSKDDRGHSAGGDRTPSPAPLSAGQELASCPSAPSFLRMQLLGQPQSKKGGVEESRTRNRDAQRKHREKTRSTITQLEATIQAQASDLRKLQQDKTVMEGQNKVLRQRIRQLEESRAPAPMPRSFTMPSQAQLQQLNQQCLAQLGPGQQQGRMANLNNMNQWR